MYFPTHEASVECTGCGQRHTTATLSDRRALGDKEDQFQRSLTEIKTLYGGRKTAELVKVHVIYMDTYMYSVQGFIFRGG